MGESITRRGFLNDTTAATFGLVAASRATRGAEFTDTSGMEFASEWAQCPDRVWLGADYWANPLQDWRIAGGRIECFNPAPDRNVHLLTRQLGEGPGDLALSVRIGRVGGEAISSARGSFGFRVGIRGPLKDYRNSLFAGTGLDAGVAADGGLIVGDIKGARAGTADLQREAVELRLSARAEGDRMRVSLVALDPDSGKTLAEVSRDDLAADRFVGNIALVANFGSPAVPGQTKAQAKAKAKTKAKNQGAEGKGVGTFWFADWKVSGSKVEVHDNHAFGPILFSQYTLSGGVLKMTAQMPPLGKEDARSVRLQVARGDAWETIAESTIHPEARTATFRVETWDDSRDIPYRLAYTYAYAPKSAGGEATTREHYWPGTVRRDPVDRPVLTVADVSCNTHAAFPNAGFVANMAKLDPDLLAFVGDQFYENSGGYGTVRKPLETATLDYLRKWYLHGWTWA